MEVKVGEKYRHFKGSIIKIISIAKHSETLEVMVIYKHGENLWARPISSFFSKEDISQRPDNVTGQKYRFEKVED